MTVNVLPASWLVGLLMVSMALSAAADDWSIKGTATTPQDGDFMYHEYHYLTRNDDGELQERRVEYRDEDDNLIALKVLTHDTDYPYVPSLDWEDVEADTRITGRQEGDQYRQRIEGPDRDEEEVASLPDDADVAFDAAFDQYLIHRLSDLLETGEIRFRFLSLGAGRTYSFRTLVIDQSDSTATLEVGPQNAVIRFFVDPITLTYDLDNERLTTYAGITNFRRDGDLLVADISYEYR